MVVDKLKRPLKWTDFKKIRTSPNEYDAQTGTAIVPTYRANIDPTGEWRIVDVVVTVSLDKGQTWVVQGKEGNPQLLQHEQGHYNLSLIGAKMAEEKIKPLTGKLTPAAQKDLKKLGAQEINVAVNDAIRDVIGDTLSQAQLDYGGLLKSVNDRYDEDPNCGTDHGKRRKAQDAWTQGIPNAGIKPQGNLNQLMGFCPRVRGDEVSAD